MSARFLVLFTLLPGVLVGHGFAAGSGDETFAPMSSPIQTYAGIWKRSPFIVETVVGPPTSMGLAARYSLVGVISLAGKPAIFLIDKNNGDPAKNRLMVSKGLLNKDGIEIVSVSMESDPRKSSAVIRQGGQQATLVFDSSAMGPTGPNSQPGAVPPPPASFVPQPLLPTMVPPPPQATGGILPPSGGSATPPPSPRRIIRPAPINLNN